jgi:hypothetical protein
VPRDLNRLCTEVLQAGCGAQQQPITAGLVQQVIAASTGVKPFPRGRLGLAVTAGLVLAASLLWVAPFRTRPPVIHSRPAARVQPESEASRPMSVPPRVAPSLQPLGTAPQASGASPPGRTPSPDPSAGDVHLGLLASVESPRLEPPLAPPIPHVTPTRPARTTSRVPAHPPEPPQQRTKRVLLSHNVSDTTPSRKVGRITAMDPSSPPPSAQGYTLMRRIYCEDLASGILQGSTDLKVMSPLSCEEAKDMLLVWEQQKDHCSFVNTTVRESQHKAKEWIGTPSCPMP